MPLIDEILIQSGLDEKEAQIYTTLLTYGALTVLEIANRSKQKRTNLYNILDDLKEKNLVEEIKEENTTKYLPKSPKEIEKLLEHKAQMVEHAKLNYEILINSLQSQYTLIDQKPIVTYLEGLHGLRDLYEDINTLGDDILLIRSTYDNKSKKLNKMVFKQLIDQAKLGIHSKVINYIKEDQFEEAKDLYTKYDPARLVEERFVYKFELALPAQVLIYGNKVSLATIKEDIIVTIIDNPDIAQTFRLMFDFMWLGATKQHNDLVKGWK